eukprot:gi/632951373/ref/XP_007891259.1/ PREDICTED: ankyrin repeat domain-containing protein 32 [Callorhinchus milii]
MAGLVQKPIIQLTGFKHPEKGIIVKILSQMDCVYLHEQEYREQCTHVVASQPSRSEKYLAACAAGKWILTKDYIIDSATSSRWLNETQYEWGYKIQDNSQQYPIKMGSVPKIWREELSKSGIPGAFHNWRVVLLIHDDARRAIFRRVLLAGKAIVYQRPRKSYEITHVLTEHKNYFVEKQQNSYKAPYFPVEYIGQFIMRASVGSQLSNEGIKASYLNKQDFDLMSTSFKDSILDATGGLQSTSFSFQETNQKESPDCNESKTQNAALKQRLQVFLTSPEAIRSKYIPSGIGCCLHTSTPSNHQIQSLKFSGVTIDRIEGILEGHFYMEALKEIRFHLSSKFFPPSYLLQSLLQQVLEGNADLHFLHEFISILQDLVLNHPPWKQSSMVSYYMDILQCSSCKKGSSFLLESIVRSCVYDEGPCHCLSNQDLSLSELKPFYRLLLKYYFDLFEAEFETLNKSCFENLIPGCSDFIPHSVLGQLLLEYMDVMTKSLAVLLECVLQATRAVVRKPNDKTTYETAYVLHGILGVVVEYRLLVNRLRGKYFPGQTWDDLMFYIHVCCQDLSQKEIEMLIKLTPSPWLQLFVTQAIYRQLCCHNGIEFSEKSFSLKQIISSYLMALGRLGGCRQVVVKDPKGKKMGHWPWPEPLRPSLTLTGDRQKQVEMLGILAKQNCPLVTKKYSFLESDSTNDIQYSQTDVCKVNLKGEIHLHNDCVQHKMEKVSKLQSVTDTDINLKGSVLPQQQDRLGKTPREHIDCPQLKNNHSAISEVGIVEAAESKFGNVNTDINPPQTEPSTYLWSILLKNYIDNHNLSLIWHELNDENSTLNRVSFAGKDGFENLSKCFPGKLMVQYIEDIKVYEELPKYIQQVLDNLRNTSVVLGTQTEFLLLHMESMVVKF